MQVQAEPLTPIDLPPEIEKSIEVHAKLENLDTGEKILLPPNIVSYQKNSTEKSSEILNAITYEVGIPAKLLGSEVAPNNTQSFFLPEIAHANDSSYKCDSTSSVCANLTFYFQDGNTNGYGWMYAEKVRTTWYRQDSAVSWSNAKITAHCNAIWLDRGGSCNSAVVGHVGNPISGSGYEIVPWFAGSNNKTVVDSINFQRAAQSIDLHRGGSNWNFSFCIVNGGASVVYGCY